MYGILSKYKLTKLTSPKSGKLEEINKEEIRKVNRDLLKKTR